MTEQLKLKLGCDPELLVMSGQKGIVIPICGLIGHGKKDPLSIGDGISVQEDGVMLEFNIEPIDYIESGNGLALAAYRAVANIDQWLVSNQQTAELSLRCIKNKSEHLFDVKDLQDPRANTIGCDPDFDAWRGGLKRPGWEILNFSNLRFGGGHIHFGYAKEQVEIPEWALVQLVDALATSPLYYSGGNPGGRERVHYYGMPGIYRPKPYGLEYRTPDNQWIFKPGENVDRRAANVIFWAINNQKKAREVYNQIDQAAAQHKDVGRMNGGTPGWEINMNLYNDFVKPFAENFVPDLSMKKPARLFGQLDRLDDLEPRAQGAFIAGQDVNIGGAEPRPPAENEAINRFNELLARDRARRVAPLFAPPPLRRR